MIKEFAVDPESVCNFQNLRYIAEHTGVPEGRVISEFPKRWKALVYKACRSWYKAQEGKEIEQSKAEEKLKYIDSKLVNSRRDFDGKQKSWLENAIVQQSLKPFRAIVSNSPSEHPAVVSVSDLDNLRDPWKATTGVVVARNPHDLAIPAASLFRISRSNILFIDPHFNPTKPRFLTVLKEFIDCIKRECTALPKLEYHLLYPEEMALDYLVDNCKERVPDVVPDGCEVVFLMWKKRDGGDAMHARYILTDRGGLSYDHGLDEADGDHVGESTDVRLLPEAVYEKRWKEFQRPSSAFDLKQQIEIKGRAT